MDQALRTEEWLPVVLERDKEETVIILDFRTSDTPSQWLFLFSWREKEHCKTSLKARKFLDLNAFTSLPIPLS